MKDYYINLTLILISYKSKKKILRFIKNISKKIKILIIENSNDKSIIEYIKSENIKIIFVKNKGYGNSINHAQNFVNTKYFIVSNPDVESITNEKLNLFCIYAEKLKDNFACLGPRYDNISSKTLKQSNINKEIGKLKSISGATMFFCKEKFDLIRGFDENFFLYFEETDYCVRAKKKGLISYQLNKIIVKHNVGTSVEFDNDEEKKEINDLLKWHFIWSKYYYCKKHYGLLISLIYFFPILLRILIKIIFYKFFSQNKNQLNKYQIRLDGLMSSIRGKKSYKRSLY